MLAILEPHINKKTINFCELSVQGSIQCFVLRDEVDELDYRYSGCWRSLVRCLWTVKTLLKMLATDAKNVEIKTRFEFFHDGRKFRRQCVNVIDITWGRFYFLTCKNFGQNWCAMTFSWILEVTLALATMWILSQWGNYAEKLVAV